MSKDLTHNPGQFDEIISIIDNARTRAMKAVNTEMIRMYWEVGAYVSEKVKTGGWGKSIVSEFSAFLQSRYPSAKGFSAQNIWPMPPLKKIIFASSPPSSITTLMSGCVLRATSEVAKTSCTNGMVKCPFCHAHDGSFNTL